MLTRDDDDDDALLFFSWLERSTGIMSFFPFMSFSSFFGLCRSLKLMPAGGRASVADRPTDRERQTSFEERRSGKGSYFHHSPFMRISDDLTTSGPSQQCFGENVQVGLGRFVEEAHVWVLIFS